MNKGTIFQINVSNGGVPKTAVRQSDVTPLGLLADDQRDKKHHGGPERAVCLFSLERIQQLQAEGHPIFPGSIGENVTVSGLDWDQMVPGVQLQLGDVLLEVTSYTVPCRHIQESFVDDKFGRVSQKSNPGWARIYTKVLQTGTIQIGDPVTVKA